MVSKKPKLNELVSMMYEISSLLDFLKEEYSYLITNYSQSKEALFLYSSLLGNVLCDAEKSIILMNKKMGLDNLYKIKNSHLSFFDDTTGIMIVS